MASIKLYRGAFGHVSMLNAASDLVTHAHPEAHLLIWLEGDAGEMTVGERRVVPGADCAIGINSFEPHSHSFTPGAEPGSFLAFYINADWAVARLGLRHGAKLFCDPSISLESWLRGVAIGLFARLESEGAQDELSLYEIERLIDQLFAAALPERAARGATGSHLDFRLRKAVDMMRANVSGRMNFDRLARNVGLSRPHFFALFKEQMNLTPNVYWNTLRMEEALRQVEADGEPLTAVACNLGFSTQSNFTRFFRDHAGVPPAVYREATRGSV
jgi:AraC-like DNA-binding protein